jgi:hypothetical protein
MADLVTRHFVDYKSDLCQEYRVSPLQKESLYIIWMLITHM